MLFFPAIMWRRALTQPTTTLVDPVAGPALPATIAGHSTISPRRTLSAGSYPYARPSAPVTLRFLPGTLYPPISPLRSPPRSSQRGGHSSISPRCTLSPGSHPYARASAPLTLLLLPGALFPRVRTPTLEPARPSLLDLSPARPSFPDLTGELSPPVWAPLLSPARPPGHSVLISPGFALFFFLLLLFLLLLLLCDGPAHLRLSDR